MKTLRQILSEVTKRTTVAKSGRSELQRLMKLARKNPDDKKIKRQVKDALEAEKLSSLQSKGLPNELKQKQAISRNDTLRLKSKFTPIFVFIYCIFVRGGWKDGRSGWKYAFQRFIAEILLQYYLLDFKK